MKKAGPEGAGLFHFASFVKNLDILHSYLKNTVILLYVDKIKLNNVML